jgi:hypothetical protein
MVVKREAIMDKYNKDPAAPTGMRNQVREGLQRIHSLKAKI